MKVIETRSQWKVQSFHLTFSYLKRVKDDEKIAFYFWKPTTEYKTTKLTNRRCSRA